jgi:hypothetical protein
MPMCEFGSDRTEALWPTPENGNIEAAKVLSFRESETFLKAISQFRRQLIDPSLFMTSAPSIQYLGAT